MRLALPIDAWFDLFRREYLQDFIKSGSAAVKFVIPQDEVAHREVFGRVKSFAEADGYLFTFVDAATTKVHLVDKLFHCIAGQTDWDALAYDFLCSVLENKHYITPGNQGDFCLEELARLNGLDGMPGEMRRLIYHELTNQLIRDYTMTQEFRVAMLRLCQMHLDPGMTPDITDSVKEWLRGDLRLISTLKSALIFQKINRFNARHMLYSLCQWLHLAGKSGLVVMMDISCLLESTRPSEQERLHYSMPAVLDTYEVLRQFIDDTDQLCFSTIVVVAPPEFLTPEAKRGLKAYDALRLRIWDEVHDRKRPNPLSSLIRLSTQEQAPQLPSGGSR